MSDSNYVIDTPIVFDRRRKKKKGAKALRDLHETERHLTKAAHRTVRAADKGMVAYRKARRKSARKRRDGAISSFIPNVAKGTTATMRAMAPVPLDLLRAGNTRQTRRFVRSTVRAATRLADDMLP